LFGGLVFSSGFVALALARSELFAEDFLVPVVAKTASLLSLGRLWTVTAVTNLAGGWVVTAIVMAGFPALRSTAMETGTSCIELGITWKEFALALIGGMLITLMTHLQHSTESDGFAALQVGAPFGYADWLGLFAFAALGNMIGGLGLVTLLRLLQGPHKVLAERSDSATRTSERKIS
jgi:formate/nitrite transporter FocA (FNT family)